MNEKIAQSKGAAAATPDDATTEHSHYRPAKQDLKSEDELGSEAAQLSDNSKPARENSASPLTPDDIDGIEITRGSKVAGGVSAVLISMKHAWREMGARRSFKTLVKLNQKDGFDCPGCAWPDPDGERAHAEFCENGVKAVAEEATLKRVTPEFFKQWSVAELSRKSDYWLGKQGRLTQPMWLRAR